MQDNVFLAFGLAVRRTWRRRDFFAASSHHSIFIGGTVPFFQKLKKTS